MATGGENHYDLSLSDWDWKNAYIDAGGTWVFGPGPYLHVPYCGDDPNLEGVVWRVRPKHPRKVGQWDFVRDDNSPTGWVMVKKAAKK